MSLKSKLKSNKLTVGSWITFSDTSVAEIMAKSGFEWLAIDMEHSAITLSEAHRLIQVIELAGVTPLVRVGENNPNLIKRVMDAGAHGVIVSTVNTAEEALRAVNAVKYPPIGTRGVGLARAQGYGQSFEAYRRWVNKDSVVIVQIEHRESIENLEEILAVEGVDASIIGPYDLSGSFGYPGEFWRPEVKKALRHYEEVNRKMKKPMGFHVVQPDSRLVMQFKKKGYVFLAAGVDMLYLGNSCRKMTASIKRVKYV